MPLTPVQAPTTAATTANAASLTNTWPVSPTQGNLLICCGCSDSTLTMTSTGWNLAQSAISSCGLYQWWKIAGASESSTVVLTPSASDSVAMMIEEYSGQNGSTPLDQKGLLATQSSTATPTTGTTPATLQADEQAIGCVGQNSGTSQTNPTYSGWSNGFTQSAELTSTGSTHNINLGVAEKALAATGTQSTVATTNRSAVEWSGLIATYEAAAATPASTPFTPGRMPLGV